MTGQRIVKQTRETIKANARGFELRQAPIGTIFVCLFGFGFSIGYSVSGLVGGLVAGFVAQIGTVFYIVHLTGMVYDRDVIREIDEYAPLVNSSDIEPFRITGTGGYATKILQPEAGALAAWANDVLNKPRMYFSERQAIERGFDYGNVIGELKTAGIVHRKPDKNGVHQLTEYGRELLEKELGYPPHPTRPSNK